MPEIGEIRKAQELGRGGQRSNKYIWCACQDCGKERWVNFIKGSPVHVLCRKCAYSGSKHPQWSGGRNENGKGYIRIWLKSDNFFYSMTDLHGYVLEHRLVVAQSLKRCLHQWEVVHHKGDKYPLRSKENKTDNRLDNLQLCSDVRHNQLTIMESKIARLQEQNRELRLELIGLKGGKRDAT